MQYRYSNYRCGPAFVPLTNSAHSDAISPRIVCDRRYPSQTYTNGSPLLVRSTAVCSESGTNETHHSCGALVARIGMESLAKSPLLARRAASGSRLNEKPHESVPT